MIRRASPWLLVGVAYVAFISLGVPDAVLGVAWLLIRSAFHLPSAGIGFILGSSTTGYFLSSTFAGIILRHMRIGTLLAISTGLVALGLFGYTVVPFVPWFMLLAFGIGSGSGVIDTGLNASASSHLSAVRGNGFRLSIEFVGPDDEQPAWSEGNTAGIIILGGGDLSSHWVRLAVESGVPAVMLDNVVPGFDLPSVAPDNLGGAHALTRYLLGQGHRRIGFIRGPSKYWTLSERLAGYMLAMQQEGVWPDPDLIPPRVSHEEAKGFGEMQRLLDLADPPTAVVAVSDKAALGAFRAAQARGIRIPDDISIVGFDDIDAGRLLHPPLTTVHVPGEEMGRVAFERLHQIIAGTESMRSRQIRWTIPTRLVLRGSVAPHREG